MTNNKDYGYRSTEGDTYSLGSGLSIYAKENSKNSISITNNRAHYFAKLAKKYRDEAKIHCENAKHFAEENSNVTLDQLIDLRMLLEAEINNKQEVGDYALKSELPKNLTELVNDTNYVSREDMNMEIDEIKLPEYANNGGKILTNDGEELLWVDLPTEPMFSLKRFDYELPYEKTQGYALLGTYVYKDPVAGFRYGYPGFYTKCVQEMEEAEEVTVTRDGYTFTGYKNGNGHIYYDISDKSVVDLIFNNSGMAWYYGVDTENERIFLPRNNWFFQSGNTDNVGDVESAGLPNITGQITALDYAGLGQTIYNNGAFSTTNRVTGTTAAGDYNIAAVALNASQSSPVYGRSETVQPKSVKLLVYMVVGNTSNVISTTAELLSDTALAPLSFDTETGALKLNYGDGLKVNNSGALTFNSFNLDAENKSSLTTLSFPSLQKTNYALLSSGSAYTAPANGYFCVTLHACVPGAYVYLSSDRMVVGRNIENGFSFPTIIPCEQNDVVEIVYVGFDISNPDTALSFIYAEGGKT